MQRNPQLNANGELQHLLSIEGLPREILVQILDTAESFVGGAGSRARKSTSSFARYVSGCGLSAAIQISSATASR